jgi:hypothetical protein
VINGGEVAIAVDERKSRMRNTALRLSVRSFVQMPAFDGLDSRRELVRAVDWYTLQGQC